MPSSAGTRTVIRMGASRFDISVLGSERIDLLRVPRINAEGSPLPPTPASRYELGEAASKVCQLHGIKGPKVKHERRPYLGKKPRRDDRSRSAPRARTNEQYGYPALA